MEVLLSPSAAGGEGGGVLGGILGGVDGDVMEGGVVDGVGATGRKDGDVFKRLR